MAEIRADPLRKMYPAANRYDAKEIGGLIVDQSPLAERVQVDKVTRELQETFTDMGLTEAEVSTVIAESRAFLPKRDKPEESHAASGSALKQLRERYGDDTPRVMGLVKQLVHRDQRMVRLLNSTGSGNSPRVVLAMAEAAIRASHRGELKTKGTR